MFKPPQRATRHCRHYEYDRDKGPTCAKHVRLSNRGDALKCMPPNFRDTMLLNHGRVVDEDCDFREEYNEAERNAWQKWQAETALRALTVMLEIPDEGAQGTIECPGCMIGTVRWTRARVNRHLWASCSTPHCFQVIQ